MKIDIYSGFLGAGKTTLIKKMISEAYSGEKLMLIEHFGYVLLMLGKVKMDAHLKELMKVNFSKLLKS